MVHTAPSRDIGDAGWQGTRLPGVASACNNVRKNSHKKRLRNV